MNFYSNNDRGAFLVEAALIFAVFFFLALGAFDLMQLSRISSMAATIAANTARVSTSFQLPTNINAPAEAALCLPVGNCVSYLAAYRQQSWTSAGVSGPPPPFNNRELRTLNIAFGYANGILGAGYRTIANWPPPNPIPDRQFYIAPIHYVRGNDCPPTATNCPTGANALSPFYAALNPLLTDNKEPRAYQVCIGARFIYFGQRQICRTAIMPNASL